MNAPARLEIREVRATQIMAYLLTTLDRADLDPETRRRANADLYRARLAVELHGRGAMLALHPRFEYDEDDDEVSGPRRVRCVSCGVMVNASGLFCPNCGDPVEDL